MPSKLPFATVAAITLALSFGCASMGGGEIAARPEPRTISLACGDQYVWVPSEQNVVLEVPASGCWTNWAAIPEEASGVAFRPGGVLDVELAFADGKTATYMNVAPTRRLPEADRATGVRYRNQQKGAVRVELVLR